MAMFYSGISLAQGLPRESPSEEGMDRKQQQQQQLWSQIGVIADSRQLGGRQGEWGGGGGRLGDVAMSHAIVLKEAVSGNTAVVVGTAHVSAQAAEEAAAVIRKVQPDYVAVELDKPRLLRVLKAAHGREGRPPLPSTTWQMLSFLISHGPHCLPDLFLRMQTQFFSALLGVEYGCDMIAAVQAAEEVGAKIVPIDRDSGVTMNRLLQQWRQQMRSSPPHRTEEKPAVAMKKAVQLAERAGCEQPEAAAAAFQRVMRAAVEGSPIKSEDLLQVRACGRSAVEFVRQQALEGKEEQQLAAVGWGSLGEVPAAVTGERDLLLAQNVQRCSQMGSTVAVVGAGHVRGIAKRWDDALSPTALAEGREYMRRIGRGAKQDEGLPLVESQDLDVELQSPIVKGANELSKEDAKRVVPIGGLLLGAGLITLGLYRPRLAGFGILGAAACLGGIQFALASTLARGARAISNLEEASRRLELDL